MNAIKDLQLHYLRYLKTVPDFGTIFKYHSYIALNPYNSTRDRTYRLHTEAERSRFASDTGIPTN